MTLKTLFIYPSTKITDSGQRQRAKPLSILLIVREIGFLSLLSYLIVTSQPSPKLLYGALLVNTLAYIVSRFRFYQWGACLIIVEALVFIPIVTQQFSSASTIESAPLWLGMGPLISSLVLPYPYTIATIVATFFSFLVVAHHVPPEFNPLLYSSFIYTMVSSLIVLAGTYLWHRADEQLETERAKLLHASKLSTLGEMAGGVAHEINTPLAVIILNAQAIASQVNDISPDISKRVDNIIRTGQRVSKIIQGLRTFSRDGQDDDFQIISATKLINDTLALCYEKFKSHGVIVTININPQDAKTYGKEVQLSQTLLNLLNNSFDEVQNLNEKWIRIEAQINGDHFEISVTDSGSGISKETVAKLFQPFFTTKGVGKGTGLGLSISRGILKSHKGDLVYDPTCKNTRFVIRLPAHTQENAIAAS